MKDIFSKSTAVVVLLLLAGCNDEFLDRTPIDKITNATYWNTESDLAVYNNSLYNIARNDWKIPIMMGHTEGFDSHFGNIWSIDELSDNMAPREPRHNFFQQIRAGKYNVPSSPDWFGYQGWDFVRAINVGLANYDRAKVSQAVKDKYIAEARLFRGWFYADKVQKYGDVPFVEKELTIDSEELYAARTPRTEAMQKVLEDLNFASQKLPNSWGDGNAPGRINRWGALLVKARVCLYEGTFNKYHAAGESKMWLEEAAKAAAELMDTGPYRLYSTGKPQSDYNAYHRILDLAGNSEVIYWRKYKTGVINNHVQAYFSYTGGATKSLVEDYLCTDGLPITLSPLYKGDETIESTFENRDPRLRQTILHPEDTGLYKYHLADGRTYPMLEGMPGGGFKTTTGYHIIKHYNADDMIGKAYNTGESPAITLRLGEALLIYAEAMAELGTISQADLDKTINKLRDRVGMPHLLLSKVPVDPRYTKDGISPIIAEIRRERRIELFMEGHRYADLIRWKQGKKLEIPAMGIRWNDAAKKRFAGTTMKSDIDPVSGKEYIAVYKGTDYEIPVFDEKKHYLWPIPLNTLAQNPKIKQNPGWE